MPWKEIEVVRLREEFVLKALGNSMSFTDLCSEYSISRKTGYKWLERFKHGGLGSLYNQSRRPKSCPDALDEAVVCELLRIKKSVRSTWGPKKVHALYERQHGKSNTPSLSSVKRVLDRAGYVQHRRRPRRDPAARVHEGMVPEKPNELWTVDFKGWWKTRDRARCEPLTVRDGFSCFLLDIRAMESQAEKAVRPVFEKIFERYGLPEAIRSDNGSPFASVNAPLGLSRLSSWWVSLGIRLDRIAPGRPDQNGAHERIHRDVRAELQTNPAACVEQSQPLFDQWRNEFNWERPHEALKMRFPGEVYTRSCTPYADVSVDISYPADWIERRVTHGGTIKLCGNQINISTTLTGFIVGLQPVADRLDVWFDYLRIGHIDLHVMQFIRLTESKKKTRRRSSSGRLAAQRRSPGASGSPAPARQTNPKVLPMS
jgi:transposase InsO family protein